MQVHTSLRVRSWMFTQKLFCGDRAGSPLVVTTVAAVVELVQTPISEGFLSATEVTSPPPFGFGPSWICCCEGPFHPGGGHPSLLMKILISVVIFVYSFCNGILVILNFQSRTRSNHHALVV